MANDVVLLFAGQGAQQIGMGADLVDAHPLVRQRITEANEILGYDLSRVMFEGPMDELTRTSRCQPALFVHGIICWELLRERLPNLRPVACAGLSLGEFTAHAVAGTFDFATGLRLVAKRGALMEEATNVSAGTMAAMVGGEEEAVRELAAECGVDVANFNAPGQIVLSGSREGIARALEVYPDKGIRVAKELTVAGAYHSRLMQSAQNALVPELAAAQVQTPALPVICNVEARPVVDPDEIRDTLARQVTGSVRWSESMQYLLAQGHRTFLELGPGGVLAGLMRRIDRAATVIRVEDLASLQAALESLPEAAIA
ncbi:MAG: [acyl-carrier-protein] S-malonyltransferase [Verrucomicrobia bacterium]|jgi:[acyl-carrier-protein] S-malonyltransferase|nr:MAG: [acyl-carrier-protein] S-malonyltransferase [Verrucomicrobiota bacterium]